MTASIHICSDSSVLLFDSVYSEVLTASRNKPQKLNSSSNKTVVYATDQVFLLSWHSGSVPQWSTVILVGLVVDDWDKSRFHKSASISSLPVITHPLFHTRTISLNSAVGLLSQLWTWVLARLCGLKIFWEFCKTNNSDVHHVVQLKLLKSPSPYLNWYFVLWKEF